MASPLGQRPATWAEQRADLLHGWELPIFAVKHAFEWVFYYLWRWGLLRVLEYSSFLSVMFAVLVYFNEAPDRKKQKHYQAWQVINTAQGKGGNGGRIEAMQELNIDKIPLVGVDASRAFLQGVKLKKANLLRSNLEASDLRDCVLEGAHMEFSELTNANFRGGNLRGTFLRDSNLENADFFGVDLTGADLSFCNLKDVDFRYAELKGLQWDTVRSMEGANIFGVKNAPTGFPRMGAGPRRHFQRTGLARVQHRRHRRHNRGDPYRRQHLLLRQAIFKNPPLMLRHAGFTAMDRRHRHAPQFKISPPRSLPANCVHPQNGTSWPHTSHAPPHAETGSTRCSCPMMALAARAASIVAPVMTSAASDRITSSSP